MRIEWNKNYTTIAIYAFLVVCGGILFFNILSNMSEYTGSIGLLVSILQPFIIGFVIAYLLNFILIWVEDKISKIDKNKMLGKKGKRGISILITYIIAMVMLYLFGKFVFPQVVESITGLVNDIPTYMANLTVLVEQIVLDLDVDTQYTNIATEKLIEGINYMLAAITGFIPILADGVKIVLSSVWNIILGTIISIYMLIDKENFAALSKKTTYALLSKESADMAVSLARRTNHTFGRFLSGKILDSAIVGILMFIILTIVEMPYTVLISFIITVTNIIPFFGPFIGGIPAVIIVLLVSPIKAFWLAIIIIVMQQIDGNIIGPKILGDSVGVSAFWIIFSLLVAGALFGFVGMVVGVPLFALIYSIIKDVLEAKLVKKGLPKDTEDYM